MVAVMKVKRRTKVLPPFQEEEVNNVASVLYQSPI